MNLQGGTANLQGGNISLQGGGGASILQPASSLPAGNATILVSGSKAAAPATAPSTPAPTPTTASNSSTNDPNAVAYYNDVISQLQSQLDAAKGQQSTGLANIDNAYNRSLTEQNQTESNAESGYATQQVQNGQQRETNVNGINDNARSSYNSLMSILGASGAGVSSAAKFGAPEAVAGSASTQRSGADTTYNSNNAAIGTAEDQTKQSYQNALTDLLTTKNSNTQNFLSGLLNTEGTLQQGIRDAEINRSESGGQSYATAAKGAGDTTAAVKGIQDQLTSIFNQYATPNFSVSPVTVAKPNLTSYSVDPTSVKVAAANPTVDSSFAPYLASLQKNNSVLTSPAGSAATATSGVAS